MADFSTEAELTLTIPTRELRSAKNTIEEEIGDVQLSMSGGGGAASRATGGQDQRRMKRWARKRTENIDNILAVLQDIEDEIQGGIGGGGGGGGGLLPFGAGTLVGGGGGGAGAGILSSLGAGALGGLGGIAGIAAAGPLAGAGLGLALREAGLGPRAQGIEGTTQPAGPGPGPGTTGGVGTQPTDGDGGGDGDQQGFFPTKEDFRDTLPDDITVETDEEDVDRGQTTRPIEFKDEITNNINVRNDSTFNVSIDQTDTTTTKVGPKGRTKEVPQKQKDEIVKEVRQKQEANIERLKRELERGLGGGR